MDVPLGYSTHYGSQLLVLLLRKICDIVVLPKVYIGENLFRIMEKSYDLASKVSLFFTAVVLSQTN